jgi:hypothetical protein
MGARLLKPAVYLLAFASVFLLLLSAVDITPDIIDGVSAPSLPYGLGGETRWFDGNDTSLFFSCWLYL